MNKKGFTLIELLAVIVVLGVVLTLAMPSILDSINASRDSSYKILIDNIKTAAETYYQECEYGDLSDESKYGVYACTIDNNTITTTIGDLANTGILKVPADDSGDLIVKDPRDKEDNTKDDNKDKDNEIELPVQDRENPLLWLLDKIIKFIVKLFKGRKK